MVEPSHVPFEWHDLTGEPLWMNPGSQPKYSLLGYTVRLPDKEPFRGTDRGPQSTAVNQGQQQFWMRTPRINYFISELRE